MNLDKFPKSLWIEKLTWPEFKLCLDQGYSTVLIGVGSIEQHGLHLPIGTDSQLCAELCKRIATELDFTLIAPIVCYGCSQHHMGFYGTMSIREHVLESLLYDICHCLLYHGVKYIVLLPMHGGNFDVVGRIVNQFKEEKFENNVFCPYNPLDFVSLLHNTADTLDVSKAEAGSHAGEIETSIALHLMPDEVRIDNLEPGFIGDYSSHRSQIRNMGIQSITKNGIIGNPLLAKKNNGIMYVKNLLEFIVCKVREKWNEN